MTDPQPTERPFHTQAEYEEQETELARLRAVEAESVKVLAEDAAELIRLRAVEEAAQHVYDVFDGTTMMHDVSYEDVSDAIYAMRAALATPASEDSNGGT